MNINIESEIESQILCCNQKGKVKSCNAILKLTHIPSLSKKFPPLFVESAGQDVKGNFPNGTESEEKKICIQSPKRLQDQ